LRRDTTLSLLTSLGYNDSFTAFNGSVYAVCVRPRSTKVYAFRRLDTRGHLFIPKMTRFLGLRASGITCELLTNVIGVSSTAHVKKSVKMHSIFAKSSDNAESSHDWHTCEVGFNSGPLGKLLWRGATKERLGGPTARPHGPGWMGMRSSPNVCKALQIRSAKSPHMSAQFGRSRVAMAYNPRSAEVCTCPRGCADDRPERSDLGCSAASRPCIPWHAKFKIEGQCALGSDIDKRHV
jgi:hypothetical protein